MAGIIVDESKKPLQLSAMMDGRMVRFIKEIHHGFSLRDALPLSQGFLR